jgi:hypothetical protein
MNNKKLHTISIISICVIMIGCDSKKKEQAEGEERFPVLAFIKSQIADIDTSLYSISMIVTADTLSDTTYIPREKFRDAAKDFLTIPDLASPKFAGRYTEDKHFDETLNKVLIAYTPVDPEKEEIQREEVLVNAAGDKVTNIIIHRALNTKDSSVQKRMLWQMDRSFQVTTIRQLPGQPETISTVRVLWNVDEGQ